MGIFKKGKIILTRFLSSRTNLTIFQCLLYFVVGYIMGEYLTWLQLGLMFVIMFLIQFITRTKAVADGMLYRQIMTDINCDANELAERMKDEVDKLLKDKDKNDYN